MKRAFFIMGAEASGATVITRAICSAGVYGDYGHFQRLDSLDFTSTPREIVLRRTCPHGDRWPDIPLLVKKMRDGGYEIVPILVLRNLIHNIESQVRHDHAGNHRIAHDSINHATDWVCSRLAEVGLYPAVVCFEPFVRHQEVRTAFFGMLGLPMPSMEFRDSAAKYRTSQDPVILSH